MKTHVEFDWDYPDEIFDKHMPYGSDYGVVLCLQVTLSVREVDNSWRFRVYVDGVILHEAHYPYSQAAKDAADEWLKAHLEFQQRIMA